ncbi:MAG TPA: shikimate kinase [Acidimicrobiales bacterium]|nr:shikimate kinase [Acidimicrobiales bacterium]
MITRSSHVVLVGGMAVGKTTVGRRVAVRLGRPLRDSDIDLEVGRGTSGRELAERDGTAALHRWESDHLLGALASPEPVVVAAAASVVDDDRCLRALAAPFVAWLRAPPRTVVARLSGDEQRRRLGADPAAAVGGLAARRAPRYALVANVTIDVAQLSPEAAAGIIVDALVSACDGVP